MYVTRQINQSFNLLLILLVVCQITSPLLNQLQFASSNKLQKSHTICISGCKKPQQKTINLLQSCKKCMPICMILVDNEGFPILFITRILYMLHLNKINLGVIHTIFKPPKSHG
jgi:hypothetical protein